MFVLSQLILSVALVAPADDSKSVEQLAEQYRDSVVVITVRGRDGSREGLGSGFVVSKDGLIATNLHVIGEGRPIRVETADNKRLDVLEVYATDRARDLAILRVKSDDLKPIPLGDSSKLKDGQDVVALGNPLGLRHSVVAGVVSGRRDIDGREMIQLAIPLERGNSGGPLLDRQGNAVGVLTLKSLVTANLGFAAGIDDLKPLLAKPNPVKLESWMTIGQLDSEEWKPSLGARWTQRAGRVQVEGTGSGFGGRAYCLWQGKVPELPFEVAVTLKLDDERGAAGLLFHDDGNGRHYGFYPTGGQLRFTRFDGPDVFSWNILQQIKTPHYRSGEWNTIRVRLTDKGIEGFVNGERVLQSSDVALTGGSIGLTKFRDTEAEFKRFRVGKAIPSGAVSAETRQRVLDAIEGWRVEEPPATKVIDILSAEGESGPRALREQAKELERRAERLRILAGRVHARGVLRELEEEASKPDAKVDLIFAALLIAWLDNEDLDVEAYRREVSRMAAKLKTSLPEKADEKTKREALKRFLFEERAFHGGRSEYYARSNSYLNEVIDDREGLPLTLSVLYLSLADAIGLPVEGVGLPGHFVVRQKDGPFIDVFEGGTELTLEDAEQLVRDRTEREPTDADFEPLTRRAILTRMLRNLLGAAQREEDVEGGLRYLDGIVMLDPEAALERYMRAGLLYLEGRKAEAMTDAQWLLDHPSEAVDERRVRQLRDLLLKDVD